MEWKVCQSPFVPVPRGCCQCHGRGRAAADAADAAATDAAAAAVAGAAAAVAGAAAAAAAAASVAAGFLMGIGT